MKKEREGEKEGVATIQGPSSLVYNPRRKEHVDENKDDDGHHAAGYEVREMEERERI